MPDWAGQILAGAMTGLISIYVTLRWLGEKIVQHKLDDKLESVKFEFNKTLGRLEKLHTAEFSVIPQLWSMICDAHAYTERLNGIYVPPTNFTEMDAEDLDFFFITNEFTDYERHYFNRRPDKARAWDRICFFRVYRKSFNLRAELEAFTNKSRIYLTREMFQDVSDFCTTLFDLQRTHWAIEVAELDGESLKRKIEFVDELNEIRKNRIENIFETISESIKA